MQKRDYKKENVAQNPSYDRSLDAKRRMLDFLGKYHIILNGVVLHEPFSLEAEGYPEKRCDSDDKKEIIEFVELLIKQERDEVIKEVEKVVDDMILENMSGTSRAFVYRKALIEFLDKLHSQSK